MKNVKSSDTASGDTASGDTAGVVVRPPVLYLGAIALGVAICRIQHQGFVPGSLAMPVGMTSVLIAIIVFAWSVREFRKAGTPLPTHQPTTALVTSGPYRWSRNPIYLSFALLQLGIGIWMNCLWVVVMAIPTLLVIHYGVILREERYLRAKLGQDYVNYTKRVRRWL